MPIRDHRFTMTALLVFAASLRLGAGPAAAAGGAGDLYVTSDASNQVRAYDGTTGTLLGVHSVGVLGSGELGLHFGDTNGLYLVGSFGGGVDEYVTATGAYVKTYSPGGGWQWAGIYAPNGNVYIGSASTHDVREYDATTGAFVRVVFPIFSPADMRIGPNGNLYVCSYSGGFVEEHDPASGALINSWALPPPAEANDIEFHPSGEILVTNSRSNVVHRYSPALVHLGTFTGTGWNRVHGIVISPIDGNIYIADGVTTQVHVFDPVTFAELDPTFLNPNGGDKIVDVEFRPDGGPTPARSTSWGRVKRLYR